MSKSSFLSVIRSSLLVWLVACFVACHSLPLIPDTKVADTPLNREIVNLIIDYRLAFEQRDSAKLLAMAHPSWFSDGGTADPSDDYNYDGLKAYLENNLARVKKMRYNIFIERIYSPEKNLPKDQLPTRMIVEVKYTFSVQVITNLGERSDRKIVYKRLELKRDKDKWLFVTF